MKMGLDRESKKAVVSATASFLAFAVLLKLSDISLAKLVVLQNQFLKVLFGGSPEFLSVAFMLQLVLAALFLSLSLALLCAYGARQDNYRTGLIAGAASSAILLALMPSVMSLFIAAAVIVSFSYVVGISNAYYSELKKWKLFRTGSNAAGKALLVINLIIALGMLATISLDAGQYREIFKADITETISAATLGTVNVDSPVIKEQIEKRVSELVETSPVFQSYIRWLPLLTALSIWIALEFFRSLILANAAGLFTAVLLRVRKLSR